MPRSRVAHRSPVPAVAATVLLLASACGSGGGARDGAHTPTPQPAATPSAGPPSIAPSPSPSTQASPSAGALDQSFGDGGIVRGTVADRITAVSDVTLEPGGGIVALAGVGDAEHPGTRSFALLRHEASGALDESFAAGGVAEHALCTAGDDACTEIQLRSILALGDGRLLVLASETSGAPESRLLVVTADGALDGAFGDDGVLELPASLGQIVLAPDGAVVGAGRGADGFALLRLTPDLAPDERLGPCGLRSVELIRDAALQSFRHVAVQPDGRILAGGVVDVGDVPAAVLARFTPDGEPDPTFADAGWLVGAPRADLFGGVSPDAGPIAVAKDGRILVEMPSAARTHRTIVRLLADGNDDATWTRPSDAAVELFPRAGGGLLTVAARQVIDFGFVVSIHGVLRRFDDDGTVDRAFGADGASALPLLDGGATLAAGAARQDDGKVVVACNHVGGRGWLLARFLP
ncbi:MAG: delta-60 repeat domain-containing protein [Thermodesulfobacteriota bacterium]